MCIRDSLLEVSEAEVAALREQNALANTESLTRILEILTDAELRLRDTASKKILLEVTLLKAIEARSAVSLEAVLKQLNQLHGGQSSANVTPANAANSPDIARAAKPVLKTHAAHQEIVAPAALAEAPQASANLTELWATLVEAVGRVSPFTRSYLVDANPVSFDKSILTIGFDPEFEDHLGLVDNARNHTLLQTKLAELGRANCQIKFIKAEAPAIGAPKHGEGGPVAKPIASPASPAASKTVAPATAVAKEKSAPVSFNKETFKNDPLIQKALEIFKGQIIEVRT